MPVWRGQTGQLERVSRVIEKIHEAALDDAALPDVLSDIGDLFGSVDVNMWSQDGSGTISDVIGISESRNVTSDYYEYFYKLDLIRPITERSSVGILVTPLMVLPKCEWEQTEFYEDFVKKHKLADVVQAKLYESSSFSGFVAVTRRDSRGHMKAEDLRLLGILLPHLAGAQRTREHLRFAAVERASFLSTLDGLSVGVLVVDGEGCVLHANTAAEQLLRSGSGVCTVRGRLHARRPDDERAIRRVLAEASITGGGTLAISRPPGRTPLAVTVQPVLANDAVSKALLDVKAPAAIVFVVDPERDGDVHAVRRVLRTLYSLTETEAAVAQQLARSKGTKDVANALGVAASTVRWHLQRVFEKTGTSRQADLARLVERLATVGGPERDERGA